MKYEAMNPILPKNVYIPDGEPHVFGDRVYVYGSHDKENGETFCMLDYQVWSAPVDDLSDWTAIDSNYSATQDPLYSETMNYMYAPDCVRGNDGKYYLYYCLSGASGKGGYSNPVSVAVCDTPDGKFQYLGFVKNPDGTPMMKYANFDPAVINDNGTIRLYFGTTLPWLDHIEDREAYYAAVADNIGRTPDQVKALDGNITGSYTVALEDDMLTAKGEPVRVDTTIQGDDYKNHPFFEGSSIRKIGDTYYFVYSTVGNHELAYATSKRPDGDFVFGGTIVSNGDVGYKGRKPEERLNRTGTNHGSIEKIGDQWYVFYHRLTHAGDYSRQACAERIEVLPDGSIPQVEVTSCGLNGGPLKGRGDYPAVICCNLTNGNMTHGCNQKDESDEPRVTSGNGEQFVGKIGDHTLMGYKYFNFAGKVTVTLTVRGTGSGSFELRTEEKGSAVGSIQVVPSENWTQVTGSFEVAPGTYPLYFFFSGRGFVDCKTLHLEQA